MKASEIRQKTEQELKEQLKALTRDKENMVLSILQKKEKNVKKPRAIRKDIARIKSILNEKAILKEVTNE